MTDEVAPTTPEVVYDLKLPEGVAPDGFVAEAKVLGLSPEQAQKMVDHRLSYVQTLEKSQKEATAKQLADWEAELKQDKTLGGGKYANTMDTVKRGLEDVAKRVPGIVERLTETGLLNDPKFVRLFHQIGQINSDDKRIQGQNSPAPLTMNDRLIANYSKKG